ncbi:peptidoglycan recognition family protein [Nonomuraea sp. NPDC050451]|uniref:peptidoglycan recognition family protein n=1 Tax=Nonomuraea sp. NPDC050451 TaxID=3364364 RepID=UPI00379A6A83
MDLVRRSEWKARQPTGSYSAMPSTPRGVKVHYTGSRENTGMLQDHELCVSRVRSIQTAHMGGNGWIDVGYSFLVCAHGKVFEGRGIGHLPAANGAGLNSGHYAVLALVGNAGLVEPPNAMVEGLRDAIAHIRERGHAGTEIRGHRDGYSTDCPGDPLYRLVTSGALEPRSEDDDDMPSYLSLGLDKDQPLELTAGDWTTLAFDVEYADPDDQHAKGRYPSFLSGKCRFNLTLSATLSGLMRGVEGQVRLYEVDKDGKTVKRYDIEEWTASQGLTYVHHSAVGTVDEGNKLRAEVIQFGDTSAEITSCGVKVLYWR